MTSDDRRQATDRPFSFGGTGMAALFLCPCCLQRKQSIGRRLKRFMGIRQWMCAGCVKTREEK